jgi:hypothetical protein
MSCEKCVSNCRYCLSYRCHLDVYEHQRRPFVLQIGYLAYCHCFSHQNSKRHLGCKVVHGIKCTELPYEDSGGQILEVSSQSYSPAFKETYFGNYQDWRLVHSGRYNGMIFGMTPPFDKFWRWVVTFTLRPPLLSGKQTTDPGGMDR